MNQPRIFAEGFAYDTETNGTNAMQDEMVGMSFSNSDGEGWYVPFGHRDGEQIDRSRVLETVAPLFADAKVPKAAHNANFDIMVLLHAGINIENPKFDTMIAASLCGHNRIGLKDLALELYRAEMTPITDLIGTGRKQITMSEVDIEVAGPYASADADFTYRLWKHFEAELDGHNARSVFETIEMPLLPVIVEMQRVGMVVETDVLTRFSAALGEEIAQIKQVANDLVGGRQFNIASNRQIGDILIDEWKAPPTRRLKTGWSMNADSLDRMRNTTSDSMTASINSSMPSSDSANSPNSSPPMPTLCLRWLTPTPDASIRHSTKQVQRLEDSLPMIPTSKTYPSGLR